MTDASKPSDTLMCVADNALHHLQADGALDRGMLAETIRELQRELAAAKAELRLAVATVDEEQALAVRMQQECDALRAFKSFVHSTLDRQGVPIDPPGPHREAGCRIGQRFDWLFAERDALKADREALLGLCRTMMAIPDMTDQQLAELKANAQQVIDASS